MPPAPDTAIGIDVGGTRLRIARVTHGGAMLDRHAEPVRADRAGFAAQVAGLVGRFRGAGDVAVGIGIPGRVDAATGAVLSAGFLDIAGLDLAAVLAEAAGLPARIENDATMALVAEAATRPEGPRGLTAMLTVGTGIGGAMTLDGRPWYGGGQAGQFGHIRVAEDGPPCNCGRRGCVETFSSGTALGRLMAEAGYPPGHRAEDLLDAAEAGEARAEAVRTAWAAPMRRAIDSLVAMADPRLLLIGGGLGAQMVRALEALVDPSPWFGFPIAAARLGDDAGVIGAGLRAFDAGASA
jgi:glucokinase